MMETSVPNIWVGMTLLAFCHMCSSSKFGGSDGELAAGKTLAYITMLAPQVQQTQSSCACICLHFFVPS